MIVDASVVLAILLEEPDGDGLEDKLLLAKNDLSMSPVNYLEVAVRLDNLHNPRKGDQLDPLLESFGIEIADIDAQQALLAREAYQKFGKGNHPAKLNLGDCFAYALSKARSEPLLFKGDDFRRTDVKAAL